LVEQGGQRGDTAYDVAVTTSDSKLIFEAKHLSRVGPSVRRESIFQLQTALSRERGLSDKKLAGILVTSADIPSSLIEYVEEVRRQGFPIWVVRWHPEEGYESLVQPVRTALADAF
jgi:hypothetical protein